MGTCLWDIVVDFPPSTLLTSFSHRLDCTLSLGEEARVGSRVPPTGGRLDVKFASLAVQQVRGQHSCRQG